MVEGYILVDTSYDDDMIERFYVIEPSIKRSCWVALLIWIFSGRMGVDCI